MNEQQFRVWDPLIRTGHWLIVAGFATAFLTEDEFLPVHVWAGYTVGVAVAIRVISGFVGPTHARFADFLFGPSAVISYLIDLLRFRGKRYIGHSPGGGAMVIAILLCLAPTVVTGLAVYGAEKKTGPLRALYAVATPAVPSHVLVATAAADERRKGGRQGTGEREGSTMKEYHEILANVTLGLVIIHIIGVIWASTTHRENLVWAMVTGHKRSNDQAS